MNARAAVYFSDSVDSEANRFRLWENSGFTQWKPDTIVVSKSVSAILLIHGKDFAEFMKCKALCASGFMSFATQALGEGLLMIVFSGSGHPETYVPDWESLPVDRVHFYTGEGAAVHESSVNFARNVIRFAETFSAGSGANWRILYRTWTEEVADFLYATALVCEVGSDQLKGFLRVNYQTGPFGDALFEAGAGSVAGEEERTIFDEPRNQMVTWLNSRKDIDCQNAAPRISGWLMALSQFHQK